MTSNRPYLIRAIYEWISDNQLTPYLLVRANRPRVEVPEHFVQDDKIVLNVAQRAVQGLALGNDEISFSARFGGVATNVSFPPSAVLAIYARENGLGITFDEEADDDDQDTPPPDPPKPSTRGRPNLKIVK